MPPDETSTFLYPIDTENGELITEYLPKIDEISRQPDSIFGVPQYLADRFPNLPLMIVKRLRADEFGLPNEQYSSRWFWDAERGCATIEPAEERPRISRRSAARAYSVIVPFIARNGSPATKQLPAVLD